MKKLFSYTARNGIRRHVYADWNDRHIYRRLEKNIFKKIRFVILPVFIYGYDSNEDAIRDCFDEK